MTATVDLYAIPAPQMTPTTLEELGEWLKDELLPWLEVLTDGVAIGAKVPDVLASDVSAIVEGVANAMRTGDLPTFCDESRRESVPDLARLLAEILERDASDENAGRRRHLIAATTPKLLAFTVASAILPAPRTERVRSEEERADGRR